MKKKINQWACYNRIWSWSPMPCEKHGPRASVTTKTSAFGLGFCLLSPLGHLFHTAWETMIKSYNTVRLPLNGGRLQAKLHFLDENCFALIQVWPKSISNGPNDCESAWIWISVCLDNDMVLNRQQVITCTNVDQNDEWNMFMVTLGLIELI